MKRYKCTVCNYIYDEAKEGKRFLDLPDDWTCPVCGSPKSVFVLLSEGEPKAPEEESTVSDILIQQIAEWGVEYIFSIPGTSSLGLVDAIRKNKKIRYIQVRHEQVAAFMASAYGKLTGHIAACLTVAGPGASNLATGLYDAKLDYSPVLALTGQVKRQLIGPGSFQEIDQHSFFEPICVFNKVLMSEDQTTTLATLAIKHALIDRGVSHISIPNDIQKIPYRTEILPMEGRITNRNIQPCEFVMQKAISIINKSKRPVIIAGFGAQDQGDKLLKLARRIGSPIVSTFRGKGVIDEDNELYVGSHGTIGSTAAAKLVEKSDLLIVIGSSFSDKTQIPEKKTIQIDIDPVVIARRYPVEVGLWGNSAEVLPKLTVMVKQKDNTIYLAEIRRLKKEWLDILSREIDAELSPLRPQYIMKVLNENIGSDAVISIDVGENAWWFGRNFWMKQSQKIILSGSLASMGFGLPGALAAQLVYPERPVVCITGDGGFSMVMGDFLTAVKYGLPVKVFLFNNSQLGMIMQEQKVENYPNWQTELHNCDFAEYARNCGGIGIKVNKPEELEKAVKKAMAADKPVIVDINTDPRRFIKGEDPVTQRKAAIIESKKNGPYLIQNIENLRNSRGERIQTRPKMILCRCGASKEKPFCDGTHIKINFNSDKRPDTVPDRLDTYKGMKITIHDNRGVCSHAGYCTDNSPEVFDMHQDHWIEPDKGSSEKTAKTIRMCPSGALSYTKDGILYKDQDRQRSITVSKNGPYLVVGGISFNDPTGSKPESKEHYTLCRCGGSKNKPFCDGTHWYITFKDNED
jgi:pyruvate oxidase/acetolactate synthase-1/2/3 large subunit